MNVFGAIEYWFSAIKVTAIVIFIMLASYLIWRAPAALAGAGATVGFHNYTAYGGFFPKGLWGAWVAVLVAVFSYLSIEMIAVAAGEAAQPESAITRAFRHWDDIDVYFKNQKITSSGHGFCGIARITFSIPLFGDSSPNVSSTALPSTPKRSL